MLLRHPFVVVSIVAALIGSAGVHAQQQGVPGVDLPKAPPAGAKPPENPKPLSEKQKSRVFIHDLEGLWLPEDYVAALQATREPHAAARKAKPLAINLQKEGRSWPIMRTDFEKAVLQRVLDIEPDGAPGSGRYRLVAADTDTEAVPADEATYMPFRGQRGTDGKFSTLSIAEPTFAKKKFRKYVRITEGLAPFVNRIVIAGKYKDEQGAQYVFSDNGEAITPDGKFEYELSLAAVGATCEYIETPDDKAPGGKRRIGFAWKGQQLQLFKTTGDKPSAVRCDKTPFAKLTREAAAESARGPDTGFEARRA